MMNDLEALEAAIDDETCAVMMELVRKRVHLLDAEYVQAVRKLCDEKGFCSFTDPDRYSRLVNSCL